MDTEYEKQMKACRDRIAACQSACMTIAVSVGIIERELIHDRAPGEVEAGTADIVEAGSHARVTCSEIDSLSEHAAAAAKGLAKASKDLEFIARAGRRLFGDIIARADAEEQRRREEADEKRREEEQRQQDLPLTSSPGAETMSQDAGPLTAQAAAAALPRYLEAAREQARQDAARGLRCEHRGDLIAMLDLPGEMAPHLSGLFEAYEQAHADAAPKKRKGAKS